MAASISEAERLLEKWTVSWEVKLWRQLWNFEDDLWAEGIILRYTSKLEKGLFIFILCAELSTSFLISSLLASAKSTLLFSMTD